MFDKILKKMEPKILLKTCHVNINMSINIFILFEKIELKSVISDENGTLIIQGTRFQDKARGNINEVKQSSVKKRKDFSNQCSVTGDYIYDGNTIKVNFKVFNNGNIIITGMKGSNDMIKNVLRLFLKNIINLSYVFEEESDCKKKFLELFDNSFEKYSKFIHNHNMQLLKLMNITKTIDIGTFDIINNNIHTELLSDYIDSIWCDDIYNFIKLFYICYYYSSKDFINNLDNQTLKNIITSSQSKIFPLSFDITYGDIDNLVNNVDVVVENINAMVKFNFILDRSKFYNYVINNALNIEPRSNPDYVDFISFEQSMYQGINIKYLVNITNRKSKYITFLIFQEGKILISGTQNEEQLKEYSEKILKLINSNRDLYEIKKPIIEPISTSIQLYPSFTGEMNGKALKIIHYTKLIELNPRNYYIIKHLKPIEDN